MTTIIIVRLLQSRVFRKLSKNFNNTELARLQVTATEFVGKRADEAKGKELPRIRNKIPIVNFWAVRPSNRNAKACLCRAEFPKDFGWRK